MHTFLSRVNIRYILNELLALGVIILTLVAFAQYNAIPATADSLLGPSIGEGSFVQGSLKCSVVENTPGDWSMTISGSYIDPHPTMFGLYYYAVSDPESDPDASRALGPVIDPYNYHVIVDEVKKANGPVVQMPAPSGESHKLTFQMDHIAGNQYFELKALYVGAPLSLDKSPVSIVAMSPLQPATCN